MTGEIRPLNPETGKAGRKMAGNRGVLRNLVACVEKFRLWMADVRLSRIRSEIPLQLLGRKRLIKNLENFSLHRASTFWSDLPHPADCNPSRIKSRYSAR